MGDDGDDDDPWFEGVIDAETEESDNSKPRTDDPEEVPVKTSDEWEWVQADHSENPDQDDDGDRLWDQFESAKPDAETAFEPSDPAETGTDDQTTVETDEPTSTADPDGATASDSARVDRTETGHSETAERPEPDRVEGDQAEVAASHQSSPAEPPPMPEKRERPLDDTELPPPPPPDEQEGITDTPPGPTRENIQEMRPLYAQRTKEFYLLWLVAALSYGIGDMLTTSMVLVNPRVGESNPFVSLILEQVGFGGFVGAKLLIFGLLIVISVKSGIENERFSYYGPPILAILVGTGLTLWNLKTILGV